MDTYSNGMDISIIKYQSYVRRKVGVIEKQLMLLDNYNIETNIMLPEAFGEYRPKYEKLRIAAPK